MRQSPQRVLALQRLIVFVSVRTAQRLKVLIQSQNYNRLPPGFAVNTNKAAKKKKTEKTTGQLVVKGVWGYVVVY